MLGAAVILTSVVKRPPVVTLKMEPAPLRPPPFVVPYIAPSEPTASAPCGVEPSAVPVLPVKCTSVASTPAGVMENTVPRLFAPPVCVVP